MSPLDPRTPYLIVNADDLGLSAGVNRAIFAGFERGIVTSASLMANGAAFDDAVEGARARPRLGVGVHLVLHDEKPVLPPAAIPALVGTGGKLQPLGHVVTALLLGRLPLAQVEAEYAAQIARVRAAGLEPTHLDSHCHLHALPALARLVHALGARSGIPCARRAELCTPRELLHAPPGRWPVSMLITSSSRLARRAPLGLRVPADFVGLARSGAVDERWLARALGTLAPGRISELMVHPGDGAEDTDGVARRGGDHGTARRRGELDAVLSPRVRAVLEARGVQLVDYRFLAAC